jgi:hypothetical protein
MIKRIITFLLIVLALFYIALGFHFYKKSPVRKNITVVEKPVDTTFVASDLIILKELFFDFEDGRPSTVYSFSSNKSLSGKKSVRVEPKSEYACEIKVPFSEIPTMKNFRRLEMSLKIWNEKKVADNLWVVEINGENGAVLSWNAEGIPATTNKWETITLTIDIKSDFLKNFNQIKTYAWNRNKGSFYVDDVQITMLGIPSDDQTFLSAPINQTTFYFDLENDSTLEKTGNLSKDYSHSGQFSSVIKGKDDYSSTVSKKISDVLNDTIKSVWVSAWLYPLSDNSECTLAMEIRNNEDELVFWKGKSTATMNLKAKTWQKLNAALNLSPEDYRKVSPDDHIFVYVVNNSRNKIYVDDFTISVGDIPEPRGEQTYVDMNTAGGDYTFNRYHPPFKNSDLIYSDIHNGNSTFLINKDSVKTGQLLPGQEIFTGNFSGHSNGRDELLAISGNEISLFNYCDKSSSFVVEGTTSFSENKSSRMKYLTGDFNGDGKKKLVLNSNDGLIVYEILLADFKPCMNNSSGIKLNQLSKALNFSTDIKLFSGKFSGNLFDELISIDRNGQWKIYQLKKDTWIEQSTGSIDKEFFGEQSTQATGYFSGSGKEEILSAYNYKSIAKYVLLEFNKNKMEVKKFNGRQSSSGVFDWHEKLISIPFTNKHDNIFSFNHQWRFEIKIIAMDNDGFFVSSVPEFKGYESDQNPKYYEVQKLIPGNFTGKGQSLLCILYNCSDKNFNGNSCSKFENVPDLPNKIQLYNFSK